MTIVLRQIHKILTECKLIIIVDHRIGLLKMKTLTVTELKNRIGSVLNFGANESLCITKNGKESYLVLGAETGRKLILCAYSTGFLSRTNTMNLLGIDWYGTLIDELAKAGIPLPVVSPERCQEMVEQALKILGRTTRSRAAMNKEFSQKLFTSYDFLFRDSKTSNIDPLGGFGFECGDGWYNILDCLFYELGSDVIMLISEKERLSREIEKTKEFLEKPQMSEDQQQKMNALKKQLKRAVGKGEKEKAEEIRLNISSIEEAIQRLHESEKERFEELKKQLDELGRTLENAPRVWQVKEKLGTLSVYGSFPEHKKSAVRMAEKLSARTCEKCGAPGSCVIRNHHHQTLCSFHSDELRA